MSKLPIINEPGNKKGGFEQNVLLKISHSIIGTLNYEKVLQIISDGMSELLDIETAAIYLLENDEELYLGATTPPLDPNMPDSLRKAFLKDHPHVQETVSTRLPNVIVDTRTEQLTPAEKSVVELRKLRSLLYFPFIQEKKALGVLILGTSNKSRTFAQNEIDLGQTVANQLSIGIQNARLHYELQIKNQELVKEIQERKKTQNALKNSETHLSNALRIAKLGHWEYNILKDTFTFTDEFYEIFHTSVDKIGGYTMNAQSYAEKFVHQDDRHIVGLEIQKTIESKDNSAREDIEHRIVYDDGQIGYIAVRYHVVRDKNGKVIKTLGVNQDITERKISENELRKAKTKLEESEYKYRNLFDQAAEGIFLMTKEGQLVQTNRAFAQMHGYTIDELNKKNIHDLDVLKERTLSARKEIMNRILKGEIVQLEVEHYHKDGHIFPLMVIAQILNLRDVQYLLCFHQDLTKQKQTEKELKNHKDNLEKLVKEKTRKLNEAIEELKSKNDELLEKNLIIKEQYKRLEETLKNLQETQLKLIRAEKMASIGVLTAGVAHEINNPLNFIQSSVYGLEIIIEQGGIQNSSQQLKNLLRIIKEGVRRSSDIVKALKAISEKRKISVGEFSVHKAIDYCLVLLNEEKEKKYAVTKNFTKETFVIVGNRERFHQVIINLLKNATQSINESGHILISTELLKEKNKVNIVISDNGIGISKKNIAKIFDPFFTTKNVGQGTGLGLSISYNIVKEHKGNIYVESELGKGSTFIIELPVKQ